MRKEPGRGKSVFVCRECGKESLRWLGQCPECNSWSSFVQQTVSISAVSTVTAGSQLSELSAIDSGKEERVPVGPGEFNRVLGGGLVPGALVLVGGEPGIGKSTLLLQTAALLAHTRGSVVYVSGEETLHQIKLRAGRLGITGDRLYLLAETNLEAVLERLKDLPELLVIDSIQAVYLSEIGSAPGSVSQVRECTMKLMRWAKLNAVPVFISGHVTKDGAIAGPRVLEHIVDAVLYLEGEPFNAYRLLRCVKNRFGSVNEIGVFEMKEEGLVEVENPSRVFLSQREFDTSGSAVVATLEGSRPLLVEIQALTNPTSFGLPRRVANGLDFGRLLLITAVLSKRVGLKLHNQDIVANVTGGLKIREPSADLGLALSIASSFRDVPVDPRLVAIGEVGLNGELRSVAQLERRVAEAARLNFRRCIIPRSGARFAAPESMELVPVGSLKEALEIGLKSGRPDDARAG